MTDETREGAQLEHRSPTAATQPVTYASPGRPMVPEWDAGNAVARGFYSNVWVYRCVQVRAQAAAGLPLRVGADPDKPMDYDAQSPLLRALMQNEAVSWRQLIAHSVGQYDVTGRFAWELDLDSRQRPVRAYPLTSQYLQPVPTTSAGALDYWAGFEYTVATRQHIKKLTPEQVMYAWRPAAHDFRQPESLLQAQRLNVSVAVMLDRYNYGFLLNDARPAAAVVVQAFEESEQFDAFQRQWNNRFGGPTNAGKPVFIEAGREDGQPVDAQQWLSIQNLGLTQKDAQAIAMMREEIRAITVGFGVPLSVLGDASDRTFANASEETANFWQGTMIPLLSDLADHINRRLAPRFGSNVVWFDTSAVPSLRPPSRFQAPVLADLVGKVVTVNEARAEVGLPPVADGDELPGPQPVPAALAAASAQPGPPGDVEEPAPADEPAAPQARAVASAGAGTTRHPEPVEPVDHEARRTKLWHRVDAQAKALESSWERQWRAHFAAQEAAVLERLGDRRGRQMIRDAKAETRAPDASAIFNPAFWIQRAEELGVSLYEAVAMLAGTRVGDQFGLAFDLSAPYVRTFIGDRANRLAGLVTRTTFDAIKGQLAEGVGAGESIDKLADRVRHVFGIATQTRAVTLARTEVIGSYNQAGDLAASQLGPDVVAGKEWLAARDARTRPHHSEADGQVVPFEQNFTVGGFPMRHPGDPQAPASELVRCRCSTGYLSPAEMSEQRRTRMVELRAAERVLALVGAGLLEPANVDKALEVAA